MFWLWSKNEYMNCCTCMIVLTFEIPQQAKGISEDVRKEMMSACKLQSSCNLTKQADAKKAKKSLNIIHIGNIY